MDTQEGARARGGGTGDITGVVLAGGHSSRMGRDKALIELPCPGGSRPQLARAYALLCSLLPRCRVSCAAGRPYPGFPCLFDTRPGRGPAEGIATALRDAAAAGFGAVLALSCDLPCMDRETLRALIGARERAPRGTLLTMFEDSESGRPEAMAAIYETGALPILEAALDGERPPRLNALIPRDRQLRLPYAASRAQAFLNMNRPGDVTKAMDFLARCT